MEIPSDILSRYVIEEHRHAWGILTESCSVEHHDIIHGLQLFRLLRSEIIAPGGRKTKIVERLESIFHEKGWREESSQIEVKVNGVVRESNTHKIDLCKGRVACEIQWNSKDGVFSRDLATLRMLHELNVISLGVIITRCDQLQDLFRDLGYGADNKPIQQKYGASTTHWSKLVRRVGNNDAGMCPVLMIGIGRECYEDDLPEVPIRPLPSRRGRFGATIEEEIEDDDE